MEIPRAELPEEVEIASTPHDERQDMLREIDNQKRKEDPTFLGAFHEKKHTFRPSMKSPGKNQKAGRRPSARTKRR
jgi:ATP-dependent RNA helicase RhlE